MVQVVIGRRLYYEKNTGVIIFDTGERVGENIVDSTIEDDWKYALELRKKDPANIGVLQLRPFEYSEEFSEAITYRVNPVTKTLEFGYKMNKEYSGLQNSYKIQIAELQQEKTIDKKRLADLELLLAEIIAL